MEVLGDGRGDLFGSGDVATDFPCGWALDAAFLINSSAVAAHLGKEFDDVQPGGVAEGFECFSIYFVRHRNDYSTYFVE